MSDKSTETTDDVLDSIMKSSDRARKSVKLVVPSEPETKPAPIETKKTAAAPKKTKGRAVKAGAAIVVRRPPRKRSGRNYKFSQTVTPETAQRYYDMQAKLDIPMGAVLEQAIAALEKEA